MLTAPDIQQLLQRSPGGKPIVSVFLDLSVNSDNKRTHGVFLSRQRTHFEHPVLEQNGKRRTLNAIIDRVERWIADEYDEANRGAALFLEIGGDLLAALQLPEKVENRIAIGDAPVVMPLIEMMQHEARHVVALVDREHLRLLALSFGRVRDERAFEPEPLPVSHDVQAGGYSQKNHQQRKVEETRHFMSDFAEELDRFAARHRPDGIVLLGTDENVARFAEHIPEALLERVVHRAHAPVGASNAELLERLDGFLDQCVRDRLAEVLQELRGRVEQEHFAVAGTQRVLEQLGQGKVETLVLARDLERTGVQCSQCNVLLDREASSCPYCGGETRGPIDLVETMARQAAGQNARVYIAPAGDLERYEGVAALLRF